MAKYSVSHLWIIKSSPIAQVIYKNRITVRKEILSTQNNNFHKADTQTWYYMDTSNSLPLLKPMLGIPQQTTEAYTQNGNKITYLC